MVKGDLIQRVLAFVMIVWGDEGLEKIKRNPDQFEKNDWFPISEFTSLLKDIDEILDEGVSPAIYQMAHTMMRNDFKFRTIFKNKDPKYVFMTTKRQETLIKGGRYLAKAVDDHHVRIEMSGWSDDPRWYEFYRGRLQGVLELTGREGTIEMTSANSSNGQVYFYDIKWNEDEE